MSLKYAPSSQSSSVLNLTTSLKKEFKNHDIIDFNEISTSLDTTNYENIIIYSYDTHNNQKQINIILDILKTQKEVYLCAV